MRQPVSLLVRIRKGAMARIRFWPRPGRGGLALLALGASLVALGAAVAQDGTAPYPEPRGSHRWVIVDKVLAGDSFYCFGGEKIQLLGIDSPSPGARGELSEPFGKEAEEVARGLIEGQRIRLTFGPRRKGQGNRTLAYAWLADGRLLNLELVREGMARLDPWAPATPSYLPAFQEAEEWAIASGLGLWAGVARAAAREGSERTPTPIPVGPLDGESETLPVYMADGSVHHAREPAIIAFGRVIWRDAESNRLIAVNATEVQLERTRPIHEAARGRQFIGGVPAGRALAPSAPAHPRPSSGPVKSGDDVVYVTDEGKHYHRKGCTHLAGNWATYSREFASKGLGLLPCLECRP